MQEKTRGAEVTAARRSHVRRAGVDTSQQSDTRLAESHAETRADAADGLHAIPTEQRSRQLLLAAAEHTRSLRNTAVPERTQSEYVVHRV